MLNRKVVELISFRLTRRGVQSQLSNTAPWIGHSDPYDLDDGLGDERVTPLRGLIIRTDYSNDKAWATIVEAIRNGEREVLEDKDSEMEEESSEEGSDEEEEAEAEEAGHARTGDSGASSSTSRPPSLFHIIDPSEQDRRNALTNACNIALLRLFCDVDVIPAPKPAPPPGEYFAAPKTKYVSPANPLVEKYGLKEVYGGRIVWVYDTKSNEDGCLRQVDGGVGAGFGSST